MKAAFLRELRAGLVPDAAIFLLALGVLTVAERVMVVAGASAGDARQVVDLLLLGCVPLMSFVSGARTFQGEAKVRRVLYLHTLPISRGALWCALVSGRFAATVLAVAGLFLVRPSTPRMLVQTDPVLDFVAPWWLLTLAPVLFVAGVCFSLIFESTLTVYLLGYPVAVFTLVQALGLADIGFRSWRPAGSAIWLWILTLASVFSLFLALSWWFFRLGDLSVRRWSLAKQAFLGFALLSLLIGLDTISRDPLLAGWSDRWTQNPFPPWRFSPGRLASPGGRYLAIAERLSKRPGLDRISIVETATGRVITMQTWRDLQWASWSGRAQVLQLIVLDHWAPDPWRTLAVPHPVLVRLSPEGTELSRIPLGAIIETIRGVFPLMDGTDLIVNNIHGKTQFLRLKERGTPLFLMELPYLLSWLGFDNQGLILSRSNLVRYSDLSYLKFEDGKLVLQPLFQSTKDLGRPKRLEDAAAVPGFFLEPNMWDLNPTVIFFFLEWSKASLSLWTRSVKSPGWERRATGLAVDEKRAFAVEWAPDLSLIREDQRPALFSSASLVVYLPTGGLDGRAALYDGALEREIPLPVCEIGRAAFPELIPVGSTSAFVIRIQCRVGPGEAAHMQHYRYLRGSGKVKPLSLLNYFTERPAHKDDLRFSLMVEGALRFAYLDETSAIWRAEDGETWRSLRNGRVRTLWPPDRK